MKPPVRVLGHQNGPRLYVLGLRVHHGLSGALVASLGVLKRDARLVAAGVAMAAHDHHDYRVWFQIEKCPK